MKKTFKNMEISVDFEGKSISSLKLNGIERVCGRTPLFKLNLRDNKGCETRISADDARDCRIVDDGAVYSRFSVLQSLSIYVHLCENDGEAEWKIDVMPDNEHYCVEWVDFPLVCLPDLEETNQKNGGSVLYPYNEGALVSNMKRREATGFRHAEPKYPSEGGYPVFPNMVCSQLLGYIWSDAGLYMGAHDRKRGVKGIDFYSENDGVVMQMRLFTGISAGEAYCQDYPIVWSAVEGRWEAVAERYRTWFSGELPPKVKKINKNSALPNWYEDSPLIVSYPVRGIHDMDEMKPNKLFPYKNALPMIDEIRNATDSKLMVLLMHWEGTAPWAPPYTWPPLGGEKTFFELADALHEKGDLIGVYCSGFGYTIQSNLIEEYNNSKKYEELGLEAAMCAGPDGNVEISHICTGQRSGYDVCPTSKKGQEILMDAYTPVLKSGVDYAQILDQNHGGGQYFCYSKEHNHPDVPGEWMTKNMQELLGKWNEIGGKMLLGCESAAAEPFIGNLLFSDNRFELNYYMGKAVPLYAYIYHEYVRNFMGNQVSCPFSSDIESLRWRMAYSFAAGDCMTLVLTPDGELMQNWGTRDFDHAPDKEKALKMIRNLTKFYKESAKTYLFCGRMIPGVAYECEQTEFKINGEIRAFPSVHTSCWETTDGKRAQIFVNPNGEPKICTVNGKAIEIPALDAVLVPLEALA